MNPTIKLHLGPVGLLGSVRLVRADLRQFTTHPEPQPVATADDYRHVAGLLADFDDWGKVDLARRVGLGLQTVEHPERIYEEAREVLIRLDAAIIAA